MKRLKCTACGANKSLLREFLPGATECMHCSLGKPMPATVYDVQVNDHSFKMSFEGEPTTWEVFQRIYGERELATSAVLETLVWPGAAVAEFGSCFGYFTLQLEDLVGASGMVIAVEPKDSYFALLSRNLELNGAWRVHASKTFIHTDRHSESKYRGTKVPAMGATEFLRDCFADHKPDLIFMDIEGYEHDALDDLCKTGWLEAARPTLVWEIHGPVDEGDPDNEAIIAHLNGSGYQAHRAGKLVIAHFRDGR